MLLKRSLGGILLVASLAPPILLLRDGGLRFVVVAVVLFKVLDRVLDIKCSQSSHFDSFNKFLPYLSNSRLD